MHTNDLLQPALVGYRAPGYQPWRLGSQVYVAFFGGALAVGAIGVGNAVMLGMPRRSQAAIAAAALVAEGALVVLLAFTGVGIVRFASIAAGLAAFGASYLLQRSPDRVYHYHSEAKEPYASLFGAGLVACVASRILEAAVLGGAFGTT